MLSRRGLFGALALTCVTVNAGAQSPVVELPKPTGPFAVGTTSWIITDETRPESFDPASGKRRIPVIAWYPAAVGAKGGPAPYMRQGMEEVRAFATLIRKPGAFDDLADVKTHGILDAPIATLQTRLPVLVFSHGYTGIPSSYTGLLEDLASHGFIVLSVIHPYEATAASLGSGPPVTFLDGSGALRADVAAVTSEWEGEDEVLRGVMGLASEKEQLDRLRGYITGLKATQTVLRRWVDDTKAVLDRWPTTTKDSLANQIFSRADLTRLGAFGHSMGGVVAGEFCLLDARCKAGLNLDGSPQSGGMIDRKLKRPFLMVYSGRENRLGATDLIYYKSAAPYFRVDVRGTGHLSFSDMPFWPGGGLSERGAYGTIAPTRSTLITRTIVREYFGLILLRQFSPLLTEEVLMPDVVVHPAERVR